MKHKALAILAAATAISSPAMAKDKYFSGQDGYDVYNGVISKNGAGTVTNVDRTDAVTTTVNPYGDVNVRGHELKPGGTGYNVNIPSQYVPDYYKNQVGKLAPNNQYNSGGAAGSIQGQVVQSGQQQFIYNPQLGRYVPVGGGTNPVASIQRGAAYGTAGALTGAAAATNAAPHIVNGAAYGAAGGLTGAAAATNAAPHIVNGAASGAAATVYGPAAAINGISAATNAWLKAAE